MDVYRFRSMEYLLGDKYQEIERRAIYFANPDELNDPVEGLRDIVWRGDNIVWTNLFKNYVWYLYATDLLFRIHDNSEELDVNNIAIPGRWHKQPTHEMQKSFDDMWHWFLNLPKISEIFETLANTNRTVRYRELECYLRIIQIAVSIHILKSDIAQEPISEAVKQQIVEGLPAPHEMLESILQLLTSLEQPETEKEFDDALRELETLIYSERIHWQLNSSTYPRNLREKIQLFFNLPKTYLDKIETLLWPNWYTACFTKDYHNSSVWGNYGDKHAGACLIFEAINTGTSNSLKLHQVASKDMKLVPFFEIIYADKPGEVDFFRSIVRLRLTKRRELWYTDEMGNISECEPYIPRFDDIDTWPKNYVENFYHDITIKTKDWKYEQECRLILDDESDEFDGEMNRTLTYDFSSLKGIIFGIKASDEDRLKIIQIIQKKCEKHDRTDFKFYQAYYSPENGDIRKREIQLL